MCDFYGRDTWAIFITQPAEAEAAESKRQRRQEVGRKGGAKENKDNSCDL